MWYVNNESARTDQPPACCPLLQLIQSWSVNHTDHIPITIYLQPREDTLLAGNGAPINALLQQQPGPPSAYALLSVPPLYPHTPFSNQHCACWSRVPPLLQPCSHAATFPHFLQQIAQENKLRTWGPVPSSLGMLRNRQPWPLDLPLHHPLGCSAP